MIAALLVAIASAAADDEVVARAGFRAITARELASRAAATREVGGNTRAADLVQDLINEALLADEAHLRGIDRDPQVVARAEAERRRLAAQRFVEKEIAERVRVPEERVRAAYHAFADAARIDLVVLASKEEAQAAADRLRKAADFAAEALGSLNPDSAAQRGEVGFVSRVHLDAALQGPAFSAPLDAVQGPLQLRLGWGVFRVRERKIGDEAGWQARRDDLRRFLESQAKAATRRHLLQQMRKQAGVKVDEDFLRSLGTRVEPAAGEAERVVAQVRGAQVRYADVAREVRRLSGTRESGHLSGPAVKVEMAWALADELLLEQAALARRYGDDPAVREGVQKARQDAMVAVLSDRLRASAPKPTDADVEAFYRAHRADFTEPARRPCAHIAVAAKEEAQELKDALARGADFAELARQKSKDRETAASGGALGEITLTQIEALGRDGGEPVLAAALREAPPGQVAGPVKTRFAWHLVRCGALSPARTAPIAEVRAHILERLTAQRGDETLIRHLDDLRARATVWIDTAALERASARIQLAGGVQ